MFGNKKCEKQKEEKNRNIWAGKEDWVREDLKDYSKEYGCYVAEECVKLAAHQS